MNKYIIKNCPAKFSQTTDKQGCFDDLKSLCSDCQDIPDCLLKRIVELCKKEPQNIMLISNGCAYGTEENKAYYLAQDILKHLEIEEVK